MFDFHVWRYFLSGRSCKLAGFMGVQGSVSCLVYVSNWLVDKLSSKSNIVLRGVLGPVLCLVYVCNWLLSR